MLDRDGTQAIDVIDRAAIEARDPASVPELLRDLAGVHVDRLGNAGGPSNVYIRGAEPNHTVVLIDGVRVNDPTDARGGGYDLAALSVGEVERIEILRGASSAQFGADAIGGVVNIVTRSGIPGRQRANLRGDAGGQGLSGARVDGSGGAAVVAGAAGLGMFRDGRAAQGGTFERQDAHAALDGFGATGSRWRLRVRHDEIDAQAFPDASGGVRLARIRSLEQRHARETLGSGQYDSSDLGPWRLLLRASVSQRDEDREAPAIAPGPGGFVPATVAATRFERDSAAAQVARRGLPWDTLLVAGVEVQREDGQRDSRLMLGPQLLAGRFRLERTTRAGFVQADAEPWRPLRVVAAVRYDDIERGDARTSRSAGARWTIDDAQSLRAHWSEGFKPPSFYALGDPLVGNPALRPEASRSSEIGYEWRCAVMDLSADAFRTRYASLVDFDPETFHMVNRDGATVRGAELSAWTRPAKGWRVGAAYTYVDARLAEPGAVLRNRPRHRASLVGEHAAGAWSASVAARYVGPTNDFSVPTGDVRLGGFLSADASIGWSRRGWGVILAVDNVTDRAYESFVGFAAPGRRVRVAVTLAP